MNDGEKTNHVFNNMNSNNEKDGVDTINASNNTKMNDDYDDNNVINNMNSNNEKDGVDTINTKMNDDYDDNHVINNMNSNNIDANHEKDHSLSFNSINNVVLNMEDNNNNNEDENNNDEDENNELKNVDTSSQITKDIHTAEANKQIDDELSNSVIVMNIEDDDSDEDDTIPISKNTGNNFGHFFSRIGTTKSTTGKGDNIYNTGAISNSGTVNIQHLEVYNNEQNKRGTKNISKSQRDLIIAKKRWGRLLENESYRVWLDISNIAKDRYIEKGEITCKTCNATINCYPSTSNIGNHITTTTHLKLTEQTVVLNQKILIIIYKGRKTFQLMN